MTGEIALKVVGSTHEPVAMNAQGYSLEVQAVSPTVTLTDVDGGTEMTVTDIHGSQTTLIPDGAQGPAGYTPVKGVDYFDGEDGAAGRDGVSPLVAVTVIEGGHRITVADAEGEQTADVMDGVAGPQGVQGETGPRGETGNGIERVVLNADYTLTITMTDGTSYTTESIRGAKGDNGYTPVKGVDYFDGKDGAPGESGEDGAPGAPGKDGISPVIVVTAIEGGHRITITDALGEHTADVMDGPVGPHGPAGYTPVKGVDYTDGADGTTFTPAVSSAGVISWTNDGGKTNPQSVNIKGPQGPAGQDGQDGVSPAITVTDIPGGHRVAITDADGQHSFDVMDGEDGAAGAPGQDGVSPTASVTQTATGAIITTTDAHGTTSAEISNGPKGDPGDPTELIDDTAGDGDTDKTWSADKLVDALADAGAVQDVQVNGTSVLQDGVANVPVASINHLGVVKAASPAFGININANGQPSVNSVGVREIKNYTGNAYRPLPSGYLKEVIFYGMAHAAGDATQKQSSNEVGQYTESAKSAISTMLNGPVSVSGTTPTINALPGIQYVCGEVSTLDITLPASGCVDVVFESGATPTVLTITPPTGVMVKWPDWFDATSLEANRTYEISFADGFGAVMSWT